MNIITPKKWYKKKRYLIPSIIIAGLTAIANMGDPVEQSSSTIQESSLGAPNLNLIPQDNSNEPVLIPENEVEAKSAEPTPTSESSPNPTTTTKPSTNSTQQVSPNPAPAVKKSEPVSTCDPNYSGGCVPIASDVDCSGGSGNGPAYFKGPATVIGVDKYKLDSDNDGLACE